MLRNQWNLMKTILLSVTSLLLSVILSAGASAPQPFSDHARPTWTEQRPTIFMLNETRMFPLLPSTLAFPPTLNQRAAFASHNYDRLPQASVSHPNETANRMAAFPHLSLAPIAVKTVQTAKPDDTPLTPPATQPPDRSPEAKMAEQHAPYKPYVTTAYYLNVRKESNNKSKIIAVVEKGDILRVVSKLDNGWLQLFDEGFVHGGYAEPVATQKGAATSTLSAANYHADAAAVSQTEQLVQTAKPSKPTSKVQSKSGLTEDHIAQILKGTELKDESLEAAILEIEDEYGINAYFTIAVMKLESGNGKSRLAKSKNNLFGLNATGGSNSQAYSFDTKADSVRRFGQLIAKSYVGKGYTTIEKVAGKYCPANDNWSTLVQRIMKSDHNKLKKSNLI